MKEEDMELGINPKPINETESRQLALLLNLLKYKTGLPFRKIRKLMKEFYNNSNIESDYKKLHRDIDALKELGFNIKLYKSFLAQDTTETNVYKIDTSLNDTKISFSNKELIEISYGIMNNFSAFRSFYLLTASQKLFSTDLDIFPNLEQYTQAINNTKESESLLKQDDILSKLIKAVKDKNPIKIQYYKNLPKNFEYRELEPYRLIKRNSVDSYLIAYDRSKNSVRKFLVPKILKVTELSGSFISKIQIDESLENYHALSFNYHEEETILLFCEPNSIWKLEKFLYPHPYKKEETHIEVKTTNRAALFQFMHLESGVIQKTNSTKLQAGFLEYIHRIRSNYA